MMSTRTNRKQRDQEEREDVQSSPVTQEESKVSAGQDSAGLTEELENAESEEPKKVRKPRKRARALVEEDVSSEQPQHEVRDGEQDEHLNIPAVLPVLPLKDTVVYPFAVQPLGVGQERSIRLIDDVMRGNRLVVLVAQKSAETEHAGPDDIFSTGTVARIARMIRMPDGTIQIIVQGL